MKRCIKCEKIINENAQLCEFCGELYYSKLIKNDSLISKTVKNKYFFNVMGIDHEIMILIASKKELIDFVIDNNLDVDINNLDEHLTSLKEEILDQGLYRELNYDKFFSFTDVELIYDPDDKLESDLEILENKEINYNSIIFNELKSKFANLLESKYLLIGIDSAFGSIINYSFEYIGNHKNLKEIFKNSYFNTFSNLYNFEEIFTNEDNFEYSSKIIYEGLYANSSEENLFIKRIEKLNEDDFDIIKILEIDRYI